MQGRVLHTVFILPIQTAKVPTYLITHSSPTTHPSPLADLLPPFKLRSKVRIRDVSDQWDVCSAWGDDAQGGPTRTWRFGSGGAAESVWSWKGAPENLSSEDEYGCWDLRAGFGSQGMGKHILIPKGKSREFMSRSPLTVQRHSQQHTME
jgi:hypothetical protein